MTAFIGSLLILSIAINVLQYSQLKDNENYLKAYRRDNAEKQSQISDLMETAWERSNK